MPQIQAKSKIHGTGAAASLILKRTPRSDTPIELEESGQPPRSIMMGRGIRR